MSPKLVLDRSIIQSPTKEDLLRAKVEELLRKNEEMKRELEELKNMI